MREIDCPSGMRLEIRGLKGKEVQLFQDKSAQRDGTLADKILNVCTISVIDPGPYKVEEGASSPKWDDVLIGDKFYAFLQIRIETYGAEYEFKTRCGACSDSFPWVLDLSDLQVKKLSHKDAEAFISGSPLVAKVPGDGRHVTFRLATGKDERAAAKAKNDQNSVIKLTALRISELDGEKERGKIQAALEEMALSNLMKLIKEFDKRDCGVETSIEVECPKCGATTEMTLPLGREFLLPTA